MAKIKQIVDKIFEQIVPAYRETYKRDSSLRSKPVKPEPPWKEPNYKNFKWGAKTGK